MVAFPAAIPITTPVFISTVAAAVLLLLHKPPLRPLVVNVACEPAQTALAPDTVPALGSGFTKIICDALVVPQALVNV